MNQISSKKEKRYTAKAVVKSFRGKDDHYMRLVSKYELKSDAQDRDDLAYDVLLNKNNKNHIQNAIKV
jgi:hypothetical protein